MENCKKIGILYIATGPYIAFWPGFYENFSRLFLPECDKVFFVFTDAESIAHENEPNVVRFYQEALPWPYGTMKRFSFFLAQKAALAKTDCLYFCNANLHCERPIAFDEVSPLPGRPLVAVSHQHTWGRDPLFHPYCRDPKSRAFIPYGLGTHYVAGGLNGGETGAFLEMCRELDARTEEDLSKNVIPVCHDESQLNRLVAERPERFRVLGPAYCVPEEHPRPDQAITILQKSRFIDMASFKGKKKKMSYLAFKWEAFQKNWLPYLWRLRDRALGRKL